MFYNFKKSFLKAIFLSVLALMGLGTLSSTFAGYVKNDIYIGDNTQAYVRYAQYEPAAALFRSMKGKTTDKVFAQKHGQAMIGIIEGFLKTQRNLDGNKKQMMNILIAMLKDHYKQYGSTGSTNTYTPPVRNNTATNTNTNTYTPPVRNNTNTNTSNSGYTPSNNYKDADQSLDNGFDSFFDDSSSSSNTSSSYNNNSNNYNTSSNSRGYTLDQFLRDARVTGSSSAKKYLTDHYNARCAFWDCGVLQKSDFARKLKLADYVWDTIGVNPNSSDEDKIEKISSFIASRVQSVPIPYARLTPEYDKWMGEHPEYKDGDKVLQTWQSTCGVLTNMYAELLSIAGVKASLYYVGGMSSVGGHGYLEINGRISDVTNYDTASNPYAWPTYKLEPNSISRYNLGAN